MPIFELEAEGKIYEVEAPSQDAALSAFKSFSSPQPGPSAPSAMDSAAGLGSAFDTGLRRGVSAIGGALGDLTDYGATGIGMAKNFVERQFGLPETPAPDRSQSVMNAIPTYATMQEEMARRYGPEHVAQNKAEEYATTIGEFAPGGLGGAGRKILQRAGQVLIPAVSSETAGQATKGTAAEPWARGITALFGGGVAALLSRPGTTAAAIKSQLPEGVSPQLVDQAEALMARAKSQGIDLAWPEALSQSAGRPILTNAMRHLEAAPQTEAKMAEFFGQRPQQVENAARGQFDNIAPANAAPSTIGPAAGRAAEETVNDVRGAINTAAKPFYDSSSTVRLNAQEMAQVRALPGYKEARDAVRSDPQLNRYVANLPDDSVGFLNEVKKQLDQSAKNAVGPLNAQPNMQRAAGLGKDAEAVRNTATNASTDYGTALAIESVAREKYLQPLLDGPLGKIAAKDTTTKNAIEALFPKNPLPNSEIEIATAVSALSKRNPKAASDLVRAHAESTFNQAAKDLQTGPNQAGGAKFRLQLVGNAQQRLNLREAVEALPNGAEKWKGFNKFLDVLEATGTRQGIGSRTAYNNEMFKGEGVGGLVSDAVKTGANPARFGQQFIDRYERYKLGKDLGQLASILTDPRSAGLLRSIAQTPSGSAAAGQLALKLLTYAGGSRPSQPVQKSN